MFKLDQSLKEILSCAAVMYIIGAATKIFFPTLYSDVMALYHVYVAGTNHAIPYIDFPMEYPPLVGLTIYASAYFSFLDPLRPIVGYGVFQAMLLGIFTLAIPYYCLKINRITGNVEDSKILSLLLISGTFFYFTFYNWDAPTVAFMIAAIYYHLRSKPILAAFLLGTGTAWKFYPGILLPLFLLTLPNRTWKRVFKWLTLFVIPVLISFSPFLLLAPENTFEVFWRAFMAGYRENSPGGFEDSWLLYLWLVIRDYRTVKLLSYLLIFWLLVRALLSMPKLGDAKNFLKTACLITIGGFFAFTGVPPQFLLMVLPLLVISGVNPLIIRLVDLLNVFIIIFWWHFPHGEFSITQIISTLRQWVLFLTVYAPNVEPPLIRMGIIKELLKPINSRSK